MASFNYFSVEVIKSIKQFEKNDLKKSLLLLRSAKTSKFLLRFCSIHLSKLACYAILLVGMFTHNMKTCFEIGANFIPSASQLVRDEREKLLPIGWLTFSPPPFPNRCSHVKRWWLDGRWMWFEHGRGQNSFHGIWVEEEEEEKVVQQNASFAPCWRSYASVDPLVLLTFKCLKLFVSF